jgi:hypothetical protein
LRLIGIRRSREILGLLAMDARAQVARRSGRRRGLTRRGLLSGAATGLGAIVLGNADTATASPTAPQTEPLDAGTRQQVLSATAVQNASEHWGAPVEEAVTGVRSPNGELVAIVPHSTNMYAFTAVSVEDPTLCVTVVINEVRDGIRYYMPDGTPLAEQRADHTGKLTTSKLDYTPADSGDSPAPASVEEFTVCFAACIGLNVGPECVLACIACVAGGLPGLAQCPICGICAGPTAIQCARACRPFL